MIGIGFGSQSNNLSCTEHKTTPYKTDSKDYFSYFFLLKICLGSVFLKAQAYFVLVFFICCQKQILKYSQYNKLALPNSAI